MYTIVLATQKGGSGKTTLAIGLALAALQSGHKVRMVDADNQGTLSNWQARRGIAEPLVENVRGADQLELRLDSLARTGIDLTVIDTASGTSDAGIAAIRACDLCLIPARPTIADIEATVATVGIARRWRKPFAFVLNQTPVRGQRVGNAADTIGGAWDSLAEVLAQPFIVMRNDHQDSLAVGLAVGEYAPSGKSADEIRNLWQWAQARLGSQQASELARVEFPARLIPARSDSLIEPMTAWKEASVPWDACL